MSSQSSPSESYTRPNSISWLGILAILGASAIYGANFVISRYSVQVDLTAADLVVVRYLVSGVLLLPILIKHGFWNLGGIGWSRGLVLTSLAGAPYMLLLLGGLHFAPVAHGSAINPGSIPIVVALLVWVVNKQSIHPARMMAFAIILAGLFLVTEVASTGFSGNTWQGDLLFFVSGLFWGSFTFLVNRWSYPPLLVAAVVAVLSCLFIPIIVMSFGQQITTAPVVQVIVQGFNQGVLNAILALYLFSYGVQKLGPKLASLFSPSIPVIATLLAIPFLGEIPTITQWIAMAMVVFGMWLAARFA